MKTTNMMKAAGVALALCAISANAQNEPGRWYLHSEAGGSFIQDLEITAPFTADLSFDPGVRAGLGIGYNFTEHLAGEIETGIAWNGAKSIAGVELDSFGGNLDLWQVPLLANLILKVPTGTQWTPYFGVGVGGVATWFNFEVGGGEFSDVDFTFGYQGTGGIKYAFSPNLQIDLAYKLLGTLDHEWTDQGGSFETDPTFTHSILLSMSYTF